MSEHLPAWLRSAPRTSRAPGSEDPAPSPTSGDDSLLYVEAPTASAALADVHESVGPDARIIGADKVLRGGLWGFFQKEMVQLAVDPAGDSQSSHPSPTPPESPPVTSAPPPAGPHTEDGLAGVLARLAADEDDAELELGATLRRELGVLLDEERAEMADMARTGAVADMATAAPAAEAIRPAVRANPAAHQPPAPPPTPAPAVESVPTPTPPAPTQTPIDVAEQGGWWSGRNLLRLGLPRPLVDGVLAQQPEDDAAWTCALSRVLAPLCRPLPVGDVALVGPRAERLARALGIVLVRTSGPTRRQGSFAAAIRDGAAGRQWLAGNVGRRWSHLVVGGSGWEGLLFEDPLAVSWVGEESLADAVRTAHDLGLVLGYGIPDRGAAEAVRATPMDLAIRLRATLENAQ